MPPPDTDLAARVRAGMAFLDGRLGAGWESAVDVERLDLKSGDDCVLGQLGGAGAFGALPPTRDEDATLFARVRHLLGWRMGDPACERLGFCLEITGRRSWYPMEEIATMTVEWRAQLAARRVQRALETSQ